MQTVMSEDKTNAGDENPTPAKNLFHAAVYPDEAEAKSAYLAARERMLDVNHWYRYAGLLSSSFQVTDEHGDDVDRRARAGDFIRIDVPGPGSSKGGGFDWVEIKTIKDNNALDEGGDRCLMTAQPSANPKEPEKGTAHFLKKGASNTIVVKRDGNKVMAVIETQDEEANKEPGKPLENIRNYAMATAGILGVSNMQWNSLAKGLIEGAGE
jgi:hypothetical protein